MLRRNQRVCLDVVKKKPVCLGVKPESDGIVFGRNQRVRWDNIWEKPESQMG